MEPKSLREIVLVMDERQRVQIEQQAEHQKETKECFDKLFKSNRELSERVIKLEEKARPNILKFFSWIISLFTMK